MIRISFIFAWYDLWIGLFWDKKKRWLYILPIPCCGIILKFKKKPKPINPMHYNAGIMEHFDEEGKGKGIWEGYVVVGSKAEKTFNEAVYPLKNPMNLFGEAKPGDLLYWYKSENEIPEGWGLYHSFNGEYCVIIKL